VDYRAYPVLCVDDDASNLQGLVLLLEDKFTLRTAREPEEALRILASEEIAILLTDLRMPGMNGIELCERAAQIRPETIRMLVTAYADMHSAIDAINRGEIARYISKPYRGSELMEILRQALDLVHHRRATREMELRLLRAAPQSAALALHGELAQEVDHLRAIMVGSLEHATDLTRSALSIVQDTHATSDLIREIGRDLADAGDALRTLGLLTQRLREGQVVRSKVTVSCDVVRAVDAMVRILRREMEQYGQLVLTTRGTPLVGMDGSALGHVVMNLLWNAAQARGDKGKEGYRMTVEVDSNGPEAVISVGDNGVGIAAADLERIFDPYFTTRPGAGGVGLSIARELVVTAGGRIDVTSALGVGSTFTVRLPTWQAPRGER
jgi:signal transduction histidine kinase